MDEKLHSLSPEVGQRDQLHGPKDELCFVAFIFHKLLEPHDLTFYI